MNDLHAAMKLMSCFQGSVINRNGEFVPVLKAGEYFNFANCENETEVKAKVLEWLSRAASKGQPYSSDKKNKEFQQFMLDGINKYLGTSFSHDDIDVIYTYLGNRCNHSRTLKFIRSGYKVELLPFNEEAS